MFPFLARVVQRNSWLVVLAWVALSASLFITPRPGTQVTKDDDVRFFPRGSPSVDRPGPARAGVSAGRGELAGRGRLRAADGPLTQADFASVEDRAAEFHQFGQANPDLGVKRIDTHRTPVIGPRLIGKSPDGPGQAVLTIVSLHGTYLSKTTRLAVDRILAYLDKSPPLPAGLRGRDRLGGGRPRHEQRVEPEHRQHDQRPRSPWWSSSCWSSIARRCWR